MAKDILKSLTSSFVDLPSLYNDKKARVEFESNIIKVPKIWREGEVDPEDITSFNELVETLWKALQDAINPQGSSDSTNNCKFFGVGVMSSLFFGNKDLQLLFWTHHKNKLISLLDHDDSRVALLAFETMRMLLRDQPQFFASDKDLFLKIIFEEEVFRKDSLTGIYFFHFYRKETKFFQEVYREVQCLRLKILDILLDYIVRENEELGKELVCFFVEIFLGHSEHFIRDLTEPECSNETRESVKILDLLSSIAEVESDLKVIQSEEALLITCVDLLKKIHSISKEPGNNLSRIQKLSELDNLKSEYEMRKQITFGFKAKLIRIIGNLSWKNDSNQNKVREMDGLSVILDCCNIDGRNPFILQWSILAIRILSENKDNRKFIASVGK